MSKIPTVGRTVRDMTQNACQALRMKMDGVEAWRRVRQAIFRCISDWEGKGSTRTVYEEVNLAIHADATSALAAECILTTPHTNFYGSFFLQLVEGACVDSSGRGRSRVSVGVNTTTWRVSQPGKTQAKAYAFRPMSDALRYLSPWEFVRDWDVQRAEAPPMASRGNSSIAQLTRWCSEIDRVEVSLGTRAVPGLHYEIVEPTGDDNYVLFPDVEDDPTFRHLWVLVPRRAPHVPVFKFAPQPSRKMDIEKRSMLLSVYYRPWTLHKLEAQERSVPFAAFLNRVPIQRRMSASGKQTPVFQNSYRRAWRWYVRGHVVSYSAARIITQALMQMPADSKEEQTEPHEPAPVTEPLPEGGDAALSPPEMRELLRVSGSPQNVVEGTSQLVQGAMQHGHKLWDAILERTVSNLDFRLAPTFDQTVASAKAPTQPKKKQKTSSVGVKKTAAGIKVYPEALDAIVKAWRAELLQQSIRPDDRQMEVLDAVLNRLRVRGRRNALGSILGRRNDAWISGIRDGG